MTDRIFYNPAVRYPEEIDCLVLPNTILLPRGHVTLNLTDPWMIASVDQALREDRMLGVVQAQSTTAEGIFPSGTLGKITTFIEHSTDHYFIMLSGLCRFDIRQQLVQHKGYCRLLADYQRYRFDPFEEKIMLHDREKLLSLLNGYFRFQGLSADLEDFEHVSDEDLLMGLILLCPLEPQEKQALLESPTAQTRCEIITALMELAVLQQVDKGSARH
jgi:Lon protease-like protein